jgi:hypothetical protein
MAARLRAAPDEWLAALATTRYIARVFPHPVLDIPLRAYEACGAWLEPVHGDGWVACGDAAMSFDPCAAQGIFSALYGSMAVAGAVQAALQGEMAALLHIRRNAATSVGPIGNTCACIMRRSAAGGRRISGRQPVLDRRRPDRSRVNWPYIRLTLIWPVAPANRCLAASPSPSKIELQDYRLPRSPVH